MGLVNLFIVAGLLALWLVWALLATACAMQAWELRKRVVPGPRPPFEAFRPPACVIVPFKGVDRDALANLHGLFRQDYPDYRLLLVVSDGSDPIVTMMREVAANHPAVRWDLVVAGNADRQTGQKVWNQLAALRKLGDEGVLDEPSPRDTALVFADSDGVPNPGWLGRLVGPLEQRRRTAVTTGYRWLVPLPGLHKRVKLGSALASVINSAVATWQTNARFTHAWGGSMALLASTAREGDLIGHWTGALSDDYRATAMARQLGRRVYFVADVMVETGIDWTMSQLAEFAYRQYLITRVHEPGLFRGAIAVHAVHVAGFVSAWAAVVVGALTHRWALLGVAAAFLCGVAVADQLRAAWRRQAARRAFGTQTFERLRPAFRLGRWATPLVLMVNLALLLRACVGGELAWRGLRYRLDAPQSVRRL